MNYSDLFPLVLSLRVAITASIVVFTLGLGIAWILARHSFPGRTVVDTLTAMPLVLPPTVLGYYLLVLLGRQGAVGQLLESRFGIRLVFTWQGAVVAAAIASLPLFVQSVRTALEGVDRQIEDAARTLGRTELSILLTITLPLAWRGILTGLILTFARSLGEFGMTLMVAGNIPGQTQTMAIAIYDAVQAGNTGLANALVAVMTGLVTVLLLLARTATRGIRW